MTETCPHGGCHGPFMCGVCFRKNVAALKEREAMTEKLTPEQTATLLWELSKPFETMKREMAAMFHPTQEETKAFLAQLDRMNAGEGHALRVEVADVKRIARSWLSLHAENERLREALTSVLDDSPKTAAALDEAFRFARAALAREEREG